MRKVFISTFCCLLISLFGISQESKDGFFINGMIGASLLNQPLEDFYILNFRTSFSYGTGVGYFNYIHENWIIEGGISYFKAGTVYEVLLPYENKRFHLDFHYVNVPILLKWQPGQKFFIGVGSSIGYLFNESVSEDFFSERLNFFDPKKNEFNDLQRIRLGIPISMGLKYEKFGFSAETNPSLNYLLLAGNFEVKKERLNYYLFNCYFYF